MKALLLLLLFAPQPAFVSPDDVFRTAEGLYREGRYAEAAERYQALSSQGIQDAHLDYNLGNAYFKSGRLGLAILHYERALRQMPSDEDTQANLEFANSLIVDVVERPDMPPYIAWMVDLYRSLDRDACAVILSFSFLLGGVAGSVLLLGRPAQGRIPAIYALVFSTVLAVTTSGILAGKLYSASRRVEAIVLVPTSDVRSGPGETNPQLAEIHEGLKVNVLASRQGWHQIGMPNGITGWVREDHIAVI